MILRIPDYYKEFHCIADKCKDSCCAGWEIDIDEETLDYYKGVPGEFGKRLRESMVEDEETSFKLHNGRCAFLNEQNLCDICTELGETALCEICLEYPRFTVEYGSVREKCLGLSCEEAGRLLFEKDQPIQTVETVMEEQYGWQEEEEEDYELEADEMDDTQYPYLEMARNFTIAILQNRAYPVEERAKVSLLFADAVQQKVNEGDFQGIENVIADFSQDSIFVSHISYDSAKRFACYQSRMEIYHTLELLDKEWKTVFGQMKELFTSAEIYEEKHKELKEKYERYEVEYEHLLVYYIFRYGMKAVYDSDYLEKVKFAMMSFLVIRDMDAECLSRTGEFGLLQRIDTARIYSKEVEHSEENLQTLAEASVFECVFSTQSLTECL